MKGSTDQHYFMTCNLSRCTEAMYKVPLQNPWKIPALLPSRSEPQLDSDATERVSLPIYEHSSSLSPLPSSRGDVAPELNKFYRLVAKIIARHRAAMTSGHSNRASLESRDEITEVLASMCSVHVYSLLDELPRHCRVSYCASAVMDVENTLKEYYDKELYYHVESHYRLLESFDQVNCGGFEYVSSLTGFLIVSVNLVASYCDSRSDDDDTLPAYIEHWRRELRTKLASIASNKAHTWGACHWL